MLAVQTEIRKKQTKITVNTLSNFLSIFVNATMFKELQIGVQLLIMYVEIVPYQQSYEGQIKRLEPRYNLQFLSKLRPRQSSTKAPLIIFSAHSTFFLLITRSPGPSFFGLQFTISSHNIEVKAVIAGVGVVEVATLWIFFFFTLTVIFGGFFLLDFGANEWSVL